MIDKIWRHGTYYQALRVRLCWCKNVTDKRAASPQIIFGANNFKFCSILSLYIPREFIPHKKESAWSSESI